MLKEKLESLKERLHKRREKPGSVGDHLASLAATRCRPSAGPSTVEPPGLRAGTSRGQGEEPSSSDDEATLAQSSENLFGKGLQGRDFEHHIQEVARTRPGKLLQHGLQTMGRFLAERGQQDRSGGERQALQPRVVRYLTTVATAARSQPLGIRNERELRTLAEGLDCLMEGKLAELGDLLMQRYKAVETAAGDAS